ncbi:hypothetical protein GGF46_000944 [Coemansia sp. RSA 552]|nr:hypothetical protein GGF46_000944 [Coemansia sp. RSA 552]
MSLPISGVGFLKTPLPQLGRVRCQKNPLVPSQDQVDRGLGTTFPGPYSSNYSTVDTIPLDQAEDDYRQALLRIRQSKQDKVIVGMKSIDAVHGAAQAGDAEIVTGTPESSSFYSDDDND